MTIRNNGNTAPIIYFAYGSNLNHYQMAYRCPTAKFIGTGFIPDHRLVFRGVADCEPSQGDECPVGIWEIQESDLQALDHYEGYPRLYGRKIVAVRRPYCADAEGIVYFMHSKNYAMPSDSYFHSIWDGYTDCGLEHDWLKESLALTQDLNTSGFIRSA
jgi:gamma-glutamylcyclotransferase (GGCT)/AIG2-like uncharacterized protein YtfP